MAGAALVLSGCGSFDSKREGGPAANPAPAATLAGVSDVPVKIGDPYTIGGVTYTPADLPDYDDVGYASWYGEELAGQPTANGETFDPAAISAAHKTLPLPSYVEVTALDTGRTILVRVNDRGPMAGDRLIDLSRGAAEQLDLIGKGVGEVRVRYLGRAPRLGGGLLLQAAAPAAATPAPRQAVAEPPSTFWVQAGSFGDPLPARLMAEGIGAPASVSAASVGGRELYRVLVGPWPDANAAEAARQSVVARGYADAALISTR